VRFRDVRIKELSEVTTPPKEPVVLAVISYRAGSGGPWTSRLYSNGHRGSPNNICIWELRGNTLIFRSPDERAPGGAWVDTLPISEDGRTFQGQNQNRVRVWGEIVGAGNLRELLRQTAQ
jgi:hypothetical protein